MIRISLHNPSLSSYFQIDEIYEVLNKEYDAPYFIIDEQWSSIYYLSQTGDYDIIKIFIDSALKLFFGNHERVHNSLCYAIEFISVLSPIYSEYGTEEIIDKIFYYFIVFNQCSVLHKSIRIYFDASLYNPKIAPKLVQKFLPFFIEQIKMNDHSLIAAESFEMITMIADIARKFDYINECLGQFDEFNNCMGLMVKEHDDIIQNKYGES